MRLFKKKIILWSVLGITGAILLFFGLSNFALAQDTFGLKPVEQNLGLAATDIRLIIARIIRVALGLLGIIALGIMLYGGYIFMTAGGNEEKVSQAKKILINGVIGLAIILSALAITQFVIGKLSEATGLGVNEPAPDQCQDIVYALAHPAECQDNFCAEFPDKCACAGQHFVVQSLTPRTGDTGMNNAVVRAVFSKRLLPMTSEEIKKFITIKYNNAAITERFAYQLLGNGSLDENAVIEAQYIGNETCGDGAKCLSAGKYQMIISPEIKDEKGQKLETKTGCGDFTAEAFWEIKTGAEGKEKVKDVVKPNLVPLKIIFINKEGKEEEITDGKLLRGKSYFFSTAATDSSGAGYGNMLMSKESAEGVAGDKVYGYYQGPTSTSDALPAHPYIFRQRRYFPSNLEALAHYQVSIKAFDIDNNFQTVSASVVILGEHCQNGKKDGDETGIDSGGSCGGGNGASCQTDLDCSYSYRCVDPVGGGAVKDKICRPFPLIENVDPMTGGAGNWLTITGRNFGSEAGKIRFGLDENKDEKVDKWIEANLADCGVKEDVWHEQWVIAEVPSDAALPLASLSAVELGVNYELTIAGQKKKPVDTTLGEDPENKNANKSWGPTPGPKNGWFEKNNIKSPGLCSVKTAGGETSALAKTAVIAIGKGLGNTQGNSAIKFGEVQAAVSAWSDGVINTFVPALQAGKVAVAATVDNKQSNGVPFEVLATAESVQPLISQIDPSSSTPKSYITIYGKNFGEETGKLFFSVQAGGASCGQNCELITNLPDFCGDTWHDSQIIAQIPENFFTDFKNGNTPYLTLERNDKIKTDGKYQYTVNQGASLPGICLLEPSAGPAPLPEGQKLNIYGVNFSSDPAVFFWSKKAQNNSLAGWLQISKKDGADFVFAPLVSGGEKIQTIIPYDAISGYSMDSGPIKVKSSDGKISNSVVYQVSDCRKGTGKLTGFHCCQEGPEAGQWKPNSYACLGQSRSAGYVWRFATGLIPKQPKVLEVCDQENWQGDKDIKIEFPSPVPWENWQQGKEACLNSSIAVRFDMDMREDTLIGNNIKLFKCGKTDKGEMDCGGKNKTAVADLKFYYASKVLYIVPPQAQLDANTWYHAELGNEIKSWEYKDELGVKNKFFSQNLKRSRPCSDDTAYCFNFRTGSGLCTLIGASINPDFYITHLLGVIQDNRFDFDLTNPFNPHPPARPYYYYVWGQGNQACTVLNVDGLGWKWESDKPNFATVEIAKGGTELTDKPKITENSYKDSRAKVTAWANSTPQEVKITAATTTWQNGAPKVITGESFLTVDLSDPKVIGFWPNCEEACINAEIKVQFNQSMVTSTYKNGLKFYKCADESCDAKTNFEGSLNVDDKLSTLNILRAYGDSYLTSSTWYLVELTGEIKAIGAYKQDGTIQEGKSLKPFQWKFRTKPEDVPCQANEVEILPNPFTALWIGEKTKYMALPQGAPDKCSPFGQYLNPWNFGWQWKVTDEKVAAVSNFSTGDKLKPYCDILCLPAGSDVPFGKTPAVCGNDKVESGEDCDIGFDSEIIGISCTYNCLRPGNLVASATSTVNLDECGDGFISPLKGEECDPGKDEQKNLCQSNCVWKGSSQTPPSGQVGVSWCGSGSVSVTAGEECDIKDPATKAGCSGQCLHLGTALSQEWCDKKDGDKPKECWQAVSVCGNGVVESGEECEITGDKEIKLHNFGGSLSTKDQAENICNNKCLLQNICDEENIPTIFPLKCKPEELGCKPDCTLWGSSPNYPVSSVSAPSLCGDGKVGTGEYGFCEVDKSSDILGENPVQVVTAIGEENVDVESGQQQTLIKSTVLSYRDDKGKKVDLPGDKQKTGHGNYYLQCGNTEFEQPKTQPGAAGNLIITSYNDCKKSDNDKINSWGVGTNSCCYARPERKTEYPADGAGFTGQAVCRNTYIEAEFAGEIAESTAAGNVILAAGYSDKNYDCAVSSAVNQTDLVNSLLAMAGQEPTSGFWQKLWQTIKHFFARLFKTEAFATDFAGSLKSKVWCGGQVNILPEVNYKKILKNGELVISTTTIAIKVDDVLEPEKEYAVVLLGGQKGLKDARGVSIKNKVDGKNLNDIWVFKTGKDICKLKSVYVVPDKTWFKKPNSSFGFKAETESTNGQQIQSIPKVYEWEWHWAPENNPVFAIPVLGTPTNTEFAEISSKAVEGAVIAVAQAKVIADVNAVDNQKDKIFTGQTELIAKFCENPWPEPDSESEWEPFKDKEYNFSVSYCADAGKSGNKDDDLPFLSFPPKVFEKSAISTTAVPGKCVLHPSTSCSVDSDCRVQPLYYNVPFGNSSVGTYTTECNLNLDASQLSANNCKFYTFANGRYCKRDSPQPYPPQYGETYRNCSSNVDCKTEFNEVCDFVSYTWVVKDLCVGASQKTEELTNPVLTEDTLRRYLMFNDVNDDAFGIQIFKNPKRLSALDWLKKKFPNSQNLEPLSIAGYDAARSGNDYYVNGLNLVIENGDYALYNNIYQISLNKGAQGDTGKVLEQILDSLEFNINIVDHGYCLNPNETLKNSPDNLHINDKLPCATDFECHEINGLVKEGTSGVCANAKTKFFRDMRRLNDVASAQGKLDKYFVDNAGKLDFVGQLKGGTFIPGHTVSVWPSWNNTLGNKIGGLPLDPINAWTQCGQLEADKQTCWNAVSSTLYCPAFSSIYEYEYVQGDNSYLLRGPLEFFNTGNNIVKDKINLDKFKIEPWCWGKSFSPFGEKCGDGILQNKEECDPPGKSEISSAGCAGNFKTTNICQDNCQWKQGVCQPPYVCGNGLVEGDETCDDGALNGTYGHCAGSNSKNKDGKLINACQGLHFQYCGNEKVDYDEKTKKPLEYCEKVPEVQVVHEMALGQCAGDNKRNCLEDAHCYSALSFADNKGFINYSGEELENLTARDFTIELWFKNKGTGTTPIFSLADSHGSNANFLFLTASADGSLQLSVNHNGVKIKPLTTLPSPEITKAQNWKHIALVYEKNTDKVNIYRDGQLAAWRNNAGMPEITNVALSIGRLISNDQTKVLNNSTGGTVDEFNIYDRLLSAKEISAHYNNGFGVVGKSGDKGLISGWHFNEGAGTRAYNYLNGKMSSVNGAFWIKSEMVTDTCVNKQAKRTRLIFGDPWPMAQTATLECDPNGADFIACSLYRLFSLISYSTVLYQRANDQTLAGGYCEKDKQFRCSVDDDCKAPDKDSGLVLSSQYFNSENSSWLQKFVEHLVNYGPCVKDGQKFNAPYNFYQEQSCVWDCQKPGDFCGDGVKNGALEQCDDGNDNDADSCRNNCLSNIQQICGNNKKEGTEECDDGNTIKGDGCSPVCKIEASDYQACGDGEVDSGQDEVCDTGKENLGIACKPEYGKSCTYCSADCKKILTVDAIAYCGNGKIDKIGFDNKLGLPILEECDNKDGGVVTGTVKFENKIHKITESNKLSCIDKGQYNCEGCKLKNNCVQCGKIEGAAAGGASPKIAFLNPLLGQQDPLSANRKNWSIYYTEDEYTGLFRNKKDADEKVYEIDYPTINLYRPFSLGDVDAYDPTAMHYFSINTADLLNDDVNKLNRIETNPLCDGEYGLFFNHDQLNSNLKQSYSDTELWQKKYGDIFPYPVNGESGVVKNDVIISPAVPSGQFRVVLRWSKTNKELDGFGGLVYAKHINNGGSQVISYLQTDANKLSWYCDKMFQNKIVDNYWRPDCAEQNGIYVHPLVYSEKTEIQSFTIDTNNKKINKNQVVVYDQPIAFFVQALNNFIGLSSQKNSDLEAWVYEYHAKQVPAYSLYLPTRVFKIANAAGTSSNATAKYWHVFNLVKVNGKYQLELIKEKDIKGNLTGNEYKDGVIETDFCSVENNIPGVVCKAP